MGEVETGIFLDKIAYAKAGTGEKKVVIFPPTHHLMWNVLVDAEEQINGYKRFIPDDFTFYILSYDPNLPKNHSSESIAEDFAQIIRENIGPAAILALSYGGTVAIPFAALYPELTEKLILIVSAYGPSGSGIKFAEELVSLAKAGKVLTLERRIDDLYSNRVLRKFFKLKMWKNWPKMEESMNLISTFINAYENLLKTPIKRKNYLQMIQAPTLIIGGTHDQFSDEESYRITAELIPNAHLELFEGETHTLPVEKIFSVRKLIRNFLVTEKDTPNLWKHVLSISTMVGKKIKEMLP